MDWVTLHYIGTVILRMEEDTFWRSTLRKVSALYLRHIQAQGAGRRR